LEASSTAELWFMKYKGAPILKDFGGNLIYKLKHVALTVLRWIFDFGYHSGTK